MSCWRFVNELRQSSESSFYSANSFRKGIIFATVNFAKKMCVFSAISMWTNNSVWQLTLRFLFVALFEKKLSKCRNAEKQHDFNILQIERFSSWILHQFGQHIGSIERYIRQRIHQRISQIENLIVRPWNWIVLVTIEHFNFLNRNPIVYNNWSFYSLSKFQFFQTFKNFPRILHQD